VQTIPKVERQEPAFPLWNMEIRRGLCQHTYLLQAHADRRM